MGRNGEADLDKTLPRGELSIFAATRWDMRVLLSAVGHLTSTIIEARIGQRYDFWKDSLAFGKPTHNRNLQFTSIQSLISWHFASPRSVGTPLFGTIVFLYARHERNHRTRTSVSASDLPPLPAGPPARQRRFSLRSGWQTLSRFRSRSRRECAGPCASANREGNPRTGRSSDSPFESLLQRVSRAAGRKALSIIRPAACVLLQQRHGGYRGIH